MLSVSRHLPAEDGIGNYAEQLVRGLRAERRAVKRLGIPYGGGDEVVALWGWLRPLKLVPRARGFDDVLVQYHPHYYVRGSLLSRLTSVFALGVVARLRPATWVIHEIDDGRPDEIGRRGKAMFQVEETFRRWAWSGAKRLVFHSSWERDRFKARFPASRREERVVAHGAFFESSVTSSRSEARARLGLPARSVLLVCIGTLAPHKGVDRVIKAVRRADVPGLELHVVGRPIRPMPDVFEHVRELRRLAAGTPAVHLHECYVSDEEFDLWIRAADAVVVAYRSAASSGVVERAHLLRTPLLTSGVGGIAEQLLDGDVRFEDDESLVAGIRRIATGA